MKYHVRNIKHSAWHEKTYHKNDFPPFFFSYISASHINPVKKKVMSSYSPEESRRNSRSTFALLQRRKFGADVLRT